MTGSSTCAALCCLALLLCTPGTTARPSDPQQPPTPASRAAHPAAAAEPSGSVILPGTPAVNPSSSSNSSSGSAPAGSRTTSSPPSRSQDAQGSYGWLFPVLAGTRRRNCVVYQAQGRESLQDVTRLFGLSPARVLADNQGIVSDPNQALGGRSVLLCGQYGQAPPKPVSTAAAAKADAAAEESGAAVRVSRRVSQTAPAPVTVPPKEQGQVLLQLKAVLDPQSNALQEWGPSQVAPDTRVVVTSHCSWAYVTCDGNSNVVRLNLVFLGLEGSLPAGSLLAKLPHLTELYLGGNALQGTLPADWATTTKLTHLYLNDNQLTGRLPPEWGSMKTLRVLSLPYNQLTGDLPATWSGLDKLEELKLNNDQFSGTVPASWAAMASLTTITLWNNQRLSGCLPAAWASKGSSSRGFFQSPSGGLSNDVKVAVMGTALTGFCAAAGSPAAGAVATPAPPAPAVQGTGQASSPNTASQPASSKAPGQTQGSAAGSSPYKSLSGRR